MVTFAPLMRRQASDPAKTALQNPTLAPSIQRSQYLADALQQAQNPAQPIQSGWELAARLGGEAILGHKARKANRQLADAVQADQQGQAAAMRTALGLDTPAVTAPPQATPSIAPQPQPAAAEPNDPFAAIIAKGIVNDQQAGLANALDPKGISNGKNPIGIRNNNPGNIRDTTIPWQGAGQPAGGFETFDTPENGIRATARNLMTYGKKGLNTIEGIVNRWAPPSENNTPAYVADLAKQMGVDPRAPLNMSDPKVLQALESGIIQHENGQNPYSPDQMAAGVGSALGQPQAAQMAPQMAMQPQMQAQPPMPQQAPQAAPQGAPQGQPQQPQFGQPVGPTPGEAAFIMRGLQSHNPSEFQAAMALGQKVQQRMMEPQKYDIQNLNGVPTWVDPYHPGQMQTGAVPQAAMSHTASAQDLGINAPQGTSFNVSPTGDAKQLYSPPNGYQSGGQGQQSFVQGGPADPAKGQNLVQGEQSLRQEYSKGVADYLEARNGYAKVVQAAGTGTPAGDIALVFGYMKTLDPGSTVREGEAATVQNSGTIPDSIVNMYNKMVTGNGRLTPGQRTEFSDSARRQFSIYEDRAKQLNERFGGMARSYGYDPSHVVSPLVPISPYVAPPQPQAPAAAPQRLGAPHAGPKINPDSVRWD